MLRFRTLSLLVVALLMVMSVAAQTEEAITINFYYPTAVDGPITALMQSYADKFHELNPNIIVNPVYTGSYNQTRDTIQTEIQAGQLVVDVAVMLAIDLPSFIEEETIVPVQDYLDAEADPQAWVDNFFPAFLANSIDEDGVLWSVPFQRSTPIMYYNADLLREAGLEVPTNNEELVTVAQALTMPERWGLEVPVAGVFPSWVFQSFATAYGQPLVEDALDTVYFNTPEALAALEFVTKLGMSVEDGGYGVGPMGGSAWGDTPTDFTSGRAAMIYHTTGSMSNILANATFEVGVAFLPSGPAGEDGTGYGTPTGGGNLYIFDSGDEARMAAAWEWTKFLASDEIQSDWGVNTGYIAATYGAWEVEPLLTLAQEKPQYMVARDHLEYATKEFTAYRSIDLQNIINGALSEIMSGAKPLSEAAAVLEQAQNQADGLLAEYR